MKYKISEIAIILEVDSFNQMEESTIKAVSVDSRKISSARYTLFLALPGAMSDGHNYIEDAYNLGVRNFLIADKSFNDKYADANYLVVEDTLSSLQKLATHHRASFPNLKKIAITGSNGKTIVKEWLYQMLHDKFVIVKSPKSYNSQIGMALSLLAIEDYHEIGIFEAGISQKGEMVNHLCMLKPDIGLITNIGHAHSEGFDSNLEKTAEKMVLFDSAKTIIYRTNYSEISEVCNENYKEKKILTWCTKGEADLVVYDNSISAQNRKICFDYKNKRHFLVFHLIDLPSFENIMHCITLMLHLGMQPGELQERINRVSGLKLRLEMQAGIQNTLIVNDAYSADLDSFSMGAEFLRQHAPERIKLAIISAFDQSGMDEKEVLEQIIKTARIWNLSELIYISENEFDTDFQNIKVSFYKSKEALLADLSNIPIKNRGILIKGARKYKLEDISRLLIEKSHSAELSIGLNAIEQNLRVYKSYLKSETGIIAVVKASAYGSGSEEVARLLERNGVDYLAVAFADEGIALRLAGINTAIMVLNPDITSLKEMFRYNLEPEIYSLDQLKRVIDFSNQTKDILPIHIKLDTGMHRLGFQEGELNEVAELVSRNKNIAVKTVFSHLASSENADDDSYTQQQFDLFDANFDLITQSLREKPAKHILNSGGISRFPDRQYDFVRLGIGLYGIDNNPEIGELLTKAHKLSASLIQIKALKAGQSVGYNRKTILKKDTKIGIVNIGYADGVIRNIGNRNYSFLINGAEAPILGNVCMDLTIVDLTDVLDPIIGDDVIIFDEKHSIEVLSKAAGTIPYEILSRISSRVQRKFLRE
ncbi:MAG: alanine racemase [Saprospiraceae bacterium]|jgi:alanine racemase